MLLLLLAGENCLVVGGGGGGKLLTAAGRVGVAGGLLLHAVVGAPPPCLQVCQHGIQPPVVEGGTVVVVNLWRGGCDPRSKKIRESLKICQEFRFVP